ncbi:MAG: alpha/beta hydrolase [Alphaproteobacteria bacterium]|nr:alpha/beta hydrolase [Alphaproteobacteria bacterium]
MTRWRGILLTLALLAAAAAVDFIMSGPLSRTVAAARLVTAVVRAAPPGPRAARAADFRVAGRFYRADLYGAAEGKAPLVLVPGAAQGGKDDSRLVSFAAALAEAGFHVLVPEIESLKSLRIGPGDIAAIADAVVHLSGLSGGVPVGLAAISYAAGPALLAALDSRAAAKIAFIAAIGGYYDMTQLVTFVTTGHYRESPAKPWQSRVPHPYGKFVFTVSNLPNLPDARDRALFERMVRAKLANSARDIGPLVDQLGPPGRAFWALLDNRDPARVAPLLAALPDAIRGRLSALDVSARDLSRLRARLILIHGRDDSIVPYTESIALAAAAPPGHARLFLVPEISHVTLRGAGIHSAWVMLGAAYALIEERLRLERRATE